MDDNISKENNGEKFFTEKFPEAVKKNKSLIIIVLIIFSAAIGTAYGANETAPNPVDNFIESQTEQYENLMDIETEEKTALGWTFFFLKNNITATIQTIGLGTLFGIFSIFSLVINGLLIGHVVPQAGLSITSTFSLLLPHGVFELTAYILAATCGIKLGIGSYKAMRGENMKPLKKVGEEIRYIIPSVLFLIVIAAIIEGILGPHKEMITSSLNLQIGLITFSLVSLSILFLWIGGKFEQN